MTAESPRAARLTWANGLRWLLGAVLLSVGPISLIVQPMDGALLGAFALLGGVAGAVLSSENKIVQGAAFVLFLLGGDYVAEWGMRNELTGANSLWQGTLVGVAALLLTHQCVDMIRKRLSRDGREALP